MSMLIKGGLITSMDERAPLVGDILIKDDRIEAVAPHIDPAECSAPCVLDAHGLTIFPGFMDVHIHQGFLPEEHILRGADAAGVTGGLLWPEEEGICRIISADAAEATNIHAVVQAGYTDVQLHERLLTLAQEGYRIACEIHSPQECRRILQLVHSTRVRLILVHLTGCEELLEAVAISGCAAVIGVSGCGAGNPWRMACRLQALGVNVAVTCSYPKAKLCHLPLCAALCVREGMDRESALRTITAAPAAISGHLRAGRICPGVKADISVYDGDPLLIATSHVMTISGGKICQ